MRARASAEFPLRVIGSSISPNITVAHEGVRGGPPYLVRNGLDLMYSMYAYVLISHLLREVCLTRPDRPANVVKNILVSGGFDLLCASAQPPLGPASRGLSRMPLQQRGGPVSQPTEISLSGPCL